MSRRTIVPRLRLLGLLLICASIIMGLLLSAAGVQSVNLSSPFAKDLAERVQTASDSGQWTGRPSPTYVGTRVQGADGYSGVQPTYNPNEYSDEIPPNAVVGTAPSHGWLDNRGIEQKEEPFTVSLWALVAPICIIGFLLWMTPMPASAPSSNRAARRR